MTDQPPKIADAPGLIFKKRKNGYAAYWQARSDLIAKGYTPQTVPLGPVQGEISEFERHYIQSTCTRMQDEMLLWGRTEGLPMQAEYDGTLKSLILAYQTDVDSGFRKKRYRTREHYDYLCRRLIKMHGDQELTDLKARVLLRWHEAWSEDCRIAMAHGMIAMLRTVISYGVKFLEEPDECRRVKEVLSEMRFKVPKPRESILTAEQADLIRAKAREMGRPSIALAQAFQFDGTLRQKDVIGEWVPFAEDGSSEVKTGTMKWLRGIRWSEIDDSLILRHMTSKRDKEVVVNLRLAPMVLDELKLAYGLNLAEGLTRSKLPASGPIIVREVDNLPWGNFEFRRWWRKLANECGIPKSVRNMDSRAGAITEATDAGADLESIRHAATHGDISMTQRYSRGSEKKTAEVMTLRVAHRNKGGTT